MTESMCECSCHKTLLFNKGTEKLTSLFQKTEKMEFLVWSSYRFICFFLPMSWLIFCLAMRKAFLVFSSFSDICCLIPSSWEVFSCRSCLSRFSSVWSFDDCSWALRNSVSRSETTWDRGHDSHDRYSSTWICRTDRLGFLLFVHLFPTRIWNMTLLLRFLWQTVTKGQISYQKQIVSNVSPCLSSPAVPPGLLSLLQPDSKNLWSSAVPGLKPDEPPQPELDLPQPQQPSVRKGTQNWF